MASNRYLGLVDDAMAEMGSEEKRAHFRRKVWERDGGLCGFCREPVELDWMHLDHHVPDIAGGPTHFDNLRPSHPFCNMTHGGEARRQSVWGSTKGLQKVLLHVPDTLMSVLNAVAAERNIPTVVLIVQILEEQCLGLAQQPAS